MRNFTLKRLTAVLLALCLISLTSYAQSKIVIVQETQNEDGTTTVMKKELQEKEDANAYLKSLKNENAENIDIHVVIDEDASEVEVEDLEEDGEMIMYIRTARDNEEDEVEDVKVIIHEKLAKLHEVTLLDSHHNKVRSDRPFLGIYLDDDGQGILVTDIVDGSGAEAAGLQSGDRILSINGNEIEEDQELREELSKHEAGDQVDIVFVRDGQQMNTEATLTERKARSFSWERDPCKVFIGVSLGGHGDHDKGIYVSGIIDDTPAEAADMQRGDVILALDGVEVNTFNELLAERNKHEPGDRFTLSILRDGAPMDVNAQFKSCEEEETEEEKLVAPKQEEVPDQEEPEEFPELELDNTLDLQEYSVFPNPSFGDINVKFSGEAVPTVLRIVDVNGKEVYREELNQFNGTYEKQLNLRNSSAETLYLQIQQDDKVLTKMIQVLPRA